MRIRPRNLFFALKDQLPLKRLWRNIRHGHLRGLFHERSHLNHNGEPKISYGSKASSLKACEKMGKKRPDAVFRSYKCLYCDGYHIGKNRVEGVHPDEAKWSGTTSATGTHNAPPDTTV